MNDNVRRKLEKGEREVQYMKDNAGDFAGGPGEATALELEGTADEMHGLAGEQVSGGSESAAKVGVQDDLLDQLVAFLKDMNLAANGFADEFPGSDTKFRMPRNRNQHSLLATAAAFHSDSVAPLEAKFIEYGLAATFRADLQKLIDNIEAASDASDSGTAQRAGATAALTAGAKKLMKLGRKLNAIVRIKYKNDAKKLGAWEVAHHLEKAPQAATPPTP